MRSAVVHPSPISASKSSTLSFGTSKAERTNTLSTSKMNDRVTLFAAVLALVAALTTSQISPTPTTVHARPDTHNTAISELRSSILALKQSEEDKLVGLEEFLLAQHDQQTTQHNAIGASDDLEKMEHLVKELEQKVLEIQNDNTVEKAREVVARQKAELEAERERMNSQAPQDGDGLSRMAAEQLIQERLATYSADIIGTTDYALSSLGSTIDYSMTSPSFRHASTVLQDTPLQDYETTGEWSWEKIKSIRDNVLSIVSELLFFQMGKPASVVLEGNTELGNCWACSINNCNVTINLATHVYISAVSIDHVSELVAIDARSAPKEFRVFGLYKGGESEHEELLAEDEYQLGINKQTQTFQIDPTVKRLTRKVKLQILSNHGHEDYTCLYRFRVHQ